MNDEDSYTLFGISIAVLALVGIILLSDYRPPPQEAFEDYPRWADWQHMDTSFSQDGDTATIRLRNPTNPRVVAILHYRLFYVSVIEVPDVAPSGRGAPKP